MRVWKLEWAVNDFKTLQLTDVVAGRETGILEFARSFEGDNSLSNAWTTPNVVFLECDEPEGDFPYFWAAECPVFNDRALNVLRDLIAPYGEFLPLASADGHFTAFKVLRFIDALDVERSEIIWFHQLKSQVGKPKQVQKISRFQFLEEKLQGNLVFRIPQLPRREIFVTDVFVDRVFAAGLNGFSFTQVWPQLPPTLSPRTVRALEASRKKQKRQS